MRGWKGRRVSDCTLSRWHVRSILKVRPLSKRQLEPPERTLIPILLLSHRFNRARARRFGVLLCLFQVVGACARPNPGTEGPSAPPALEWTEVLRLRAARDYFTLRERLEAVAERATPPARFARAVVQHAFNEPAASNASIAALLADTRLPDSLVTILRRIHVANDLRLFAYRAGLAMTDTILADTSGIDPAMLQDLRNTRRIFWALAAVRPQTVQVRGSATLRIDGGRVPVQVRDSARHYVFDTGANLSTIMRSEARALGLRLYPAGIDVGTSTDQRIRADLAVAEQLRLGSAEYHNVVFLVLDDSLLTFPGGLRIPGIIGFPVIEQLGEVRIGRGGELTISARPASASGPRNLAFDELTPLTRVGWHHAAGGATLLCRVDTGADRTQLYDPFYRRFRAQLDPVSSPATRRMGGAGGVRELPVRVMSHLRLALGDTVVTLDSADVLTQSIVRDSADDFVDCNIGHDVLDAFPSYIVNFRQMTFLLR